MITFFIQVVLLALSCVAGLIGVLEKRPLSVQGKATVATIVGVWLLSMLLLGLQFRESVASNTQRQALRRVGGAALLRGVERLSDISSLFACLARVPDDFVGPLQAGGDPPSPIALREYSVFARLVDTNGFGLGRTDSLRSPYGSRLAGLGLRNRPLTYVVSTGTREARSMLRDVSTRYSSSLDASTLGSVEALLSDPFCVHLAEIDTRLQGIATLVNSSNIPIAFPFQHRMYLEFTSRLQDVRVRAQASVEGR